MVATTLPASGPSETGTGPHVGSWPADGLAGALVAITPDSKLALACEPLVQPTTANTRNDPEAALTITGIAADGRGADGHATALGVPDRVE